MIHSPAWLRSSPNVAAHTKPRAPDNEPNLRKPHWTRPHHHPQHLTTPSQAIATPQPGVVELPTSPSPHPPRPTRPYLPGPHRARAALHPGPIPPTRPARTTYA